MVLFPATEREPASQPRAEQESATSGCRTSSDQPPSSSPLSRLASFLLTPFLAAGLAVFSILVTTWPLLIPTAMPAGAILMLWGGENAERGGNDEA